LGVALFDEQMKLFDPVDQGTGTGDRRSVGIDADGREVSQQDVERTPQPQTSQRCAQTKVDAGGERTMSRLPIRYIRAALTR
jgi:hypothetical protein